jgi:hypothetical protein
VSLKDSLLENTALGCDGMYSKRRNAWMRLFSLLCHTVTPFHMARVLPEFKFDRHYRNH